MKPALELQQLLGGTFYTIFKYRDSWLSELVGMELWDLGKKIGGILVPNTIATGLMIGLKTYYGYNLTIQNIILINVLLGIALVLLWHEIRLRNLEGGKANGSQKKRRE